MSDGIFVLNGDALVEMNEDPYDNEDRLLLRPGGLVVFEQLAAIRFAVGFRGQFDGLGLLLDQAAGTLPLPA